MVVVGLDEKVDFPEFNLTGVVAKIDTGADGTSLHCDYIQQKDNLIEFTPLDPSYPQYKNQKIEKPILGTQEVMSSNGESEDRFFIETTIIIKNKEYITNVSLTNRAKMKTPVLIGKNVLKGAFLVNPAL